MSDLIDREAAIHKIEPWMYSKGRGESEINMLRAVIDTLKNMTAAPRWHRVEEPPKEEGRYLVASRWCKDNHLSYDLAYYTTKLENCYFLEDGICGAGWNMWSDYEDCDIRVFPDYWMPIEPPKEVQE